MDGKEPCSVCGSLELLRGDGKVRRHYELLMGKGGLHRSGSRCASTGELPEPAEELVAAAGGA